MSEYSRFYCKECRDSTMHFKPSAQAPHYCLRHDNQAMKSYDSQAERMRQAILEAKEFVTPIPSWTAIRNSN